MQTTTDADRRLVRSVCVYRLTAVAALILVATAPASAPAATPPMVTAHGLRISLPTGWRVSNWTWSDCVEPAQTLALVTGKHPVRSGGLLLVLEDTMSPPEAFPPRPTFRSLTKPVTLEGCCGTPAAAAYDFSLRENGRNLRIYLWARDRRVAKTAVAALSTLRVSAG
jgi:hypothetical protein